MGPLRLEDLMGPLFYFALYRNVSEDALSLVMVRPIVDNHNNCNIVGNSEHIVT